MSDDELRDGFGEQIAGALATRSRSDASMVTAVEMRTGAQRRQARRRVAAGALAVAAAAAAIGVVVGRATDNGSIATVDPSTSTSSSSAPTTSTLPTTTLPTTTVPAISGPPVDWPVTDATRAALVAAFAAGQHLDPAYVAGTVGHVYAAYEPATRTYWALANFSSSNAAKLAHDRYQGTAKDPYIQFQDGPLKFSSTDGAAWTQLGDTGGLICPPPPVSVLNLWGVYGKQNCP